MEQEKLKELMEMHRAGMSTPAISHELDVSPQTVRNVIRTYGSDEGTEDSPSRNEVKIVEQYEEGLPIKEILVEHEITRPQLYYILEKYSIPTRKAKLELGRQRQLDEAIELYKQGMVIRRITEETGVHQPTLHAEIARRGVPLRRPRSGS